MRKQVVYDLTEVMLASTGRLRYYGIARVVSEVAIALKKLDPSIRFAVFSVGHMKFFEVFPVIDADGNITFNTPVSVDEKRIRRLFHKENKIRDLFLRAFRPLLDHFNRKRWDKAVGPLPIIKMDGTVLVSCGRPKIIVDMILATEAAGAECEFLPLLHDMIPMHDFKHSFPGFPRNFTGDTSFIISKATALLTNSEFTKAELETFSRQGGLPALPPVFPIPLAHECLKGAEESLIDLPKQPYVMTVGTSLGRKNLDVVLQAFRQLVAKGRPAPTLVLAGALRKKTAKHLRSAECDTIRDHVVCIENPNQTDLVRLYKHATALVIPSKMEGWGLPSGEALWLGTPVLSSTAPALKEVGRDWALYFDPDSPDELEELITKLMADERFDKDVRTHIANGKSLMRTWSDVAGDILKALRQSPT